MDIKENARLVKNEILLDKSDAILSKYLQKDEIEVLYAILSKFEPEIRLEIVKAMY